MSRTPSGPERIVVPPSNNVYTVLTALACVAVLIGLAVVIMRANAIGIELFKFGS